MRVTASPLPEWWLLERVANVHLRYWLHLMIPTHNFIGVLQGRVPDWDSTMGGFGQSLSGGVRYSTRLLSSGRDYHQQAVSTGCSHQMASGGPRSWLITGGVGALGLLTASWLQSQNPAASLMLCSRSGRAAVATNGLQELMQTACSITISQ